ncbi:DUF5305 domain-containing protein [Proteiniborus sp.]|uniref:DUF5305 domain-containing protein n=1 Tax=Proteiniborus sp. TaxID=2079015 RepID=UPI0033216E67
MKIKINKKLKIGLISILVLSVGFISFLLFKEVNYPVIEEQKIPLYSYNNKSTVNYKIFLKPNMLYPTNSLDEGMIYLTEFVDYIKTTFNYEFSGDRAVNIEGTYDIVAKVQGFNMEKEQVMSIWEKNYTLVSQKNFNINDRTKAIKEEINISLDQYNDFVKQITEATKINCQTNLNVIMNINLKGSIDNNQIEESISPSIVIPLNTNMFQISGNTNIEKPGAIEETKQVQLPVNKNQVMFYGIILGVLVIVLALLIFFTEAIIVVKDPYEKLLKQIFKKHGDRLVALNSNPAVTLEGAVMVKSIDDLVRIADEVGKPIMYKYRPDYKEINKFYVTNEEEIYILDLNSMLNAGESEKQDKKASNEVEELMDKIKEFKSKSIEDKKEESKIES